MTPPNIRQARSDGLKDIARLLVSGDREHASAMPYIFNNRESLPRAEAILSRLKDDDAAVFVAEVENQIVGIIHLEVQSEEGSPGEQQRDHGWVLTVDVEPSHRRGGIGRTLMKVAEEWAQSKGVDHLEFMVWEFNISAIRFYSELGYTIINHTMSKAL